MSFFTVSFALFSKLNLISSVSGNAINHMAGADHLKNLKSFLWKFGGKMDQLDSFRIPEAGLAKWEKKCKSLTNGATSEGSGQTSIGPSNDIHNELNSTCVDNHEKNINHFVSSSFSNCVMPLQYHTNEKNQVWNSDLSEVSGVGAPNGATSYLSAETRFRANPLGSNNSAGHMDNQQSFVSNRQRWVGDGFFSNGGLYQAQLDSRILAGASSSQGLHGLTQILCGVQENEGNVHTGALPPWFDSSEKSLLDVGPNLDSRSRNKKSEKIQKLNPKRVGAAWAEKRKLELEMEKRGDIVSNNFNDNWLPNFGRVWQSGTRKESKKQFNEENRDSLKTKPQLETLIEIQPYVSKRKRMKTGNDE